MPALDPLSRLVALAGEISRFADAMERETDLDSRVFRAWQTQLVAIASDLQHQGAITASGGEARR